MSVQKQNRWVIITAIAFSLFIGAQVFSYGMTGMTAISPESDLSVRLVALDTDAGITTAADRHQLADSIHFTDTQIWVDPDLAGATTFTLTSSGLVRLFFTEGKSIPIPHDQCLQPDIIVTLTEPIPVIEGDPKAFTTTDGSPVQLYKTTFEVVFKTSADAYPESLYAEIAARPHKELLLSGVQVTPPVGEVWKGNAYLEYEIRNLPGAFIYEIRINRDPKVNLILPENQLTPNLEAGAIPGIAKAMYESQAAVSFYDSLDGQTITDFENAKTNRGVFLLDAELGAGADPILIYHTFLPDEFKGWNIYDVFVQYQVAVIVAIPEEYTIDPNTGQALDPEQVLSGSTREEDIGDPQYYRTDIKDVESFLDRVLEEAIPELKNYYAILRLIFWMVVAVLVGAVIIKIIFWITLVRKVVP